MRIPVTLPQVREDRILTGASTGPCPDAKNTIAITKAVAKATNRICAVCGGLDLACGTGDARMDGRAFSRRELIRRRRPMYPQTR